MKKKILIIDDDRDFVEIMTRDLENRGYEVSSAYDGRRGVEKARLERPDLIMLDVMLPEVDGYSVSRFLKFDIKYRDIPLLIFSSRHETSPALVVEVGADAYISKSVDAEVLFEKVESLLKTGPSKLLDIRMEEPALPFFQKASAEVSGATIDELKTKIRRLIAINEAIYDINRSLEIDACINKLIEKASQMLTAEISSLMLLDKKKNELVLKLAKGIKDEIIKDTRIKMGEGVSGLVAKEAKPLLVDDMKKYPQFQKGKKRDYKTESFISVPLVVDKEVLGVLNVTDKADRTSFTKEDLETLIPIVDNAAISIRNSILYEELRRVSKVKSESLAIVSHELKSPLVNVKGSIELLLRDPRSTLTKEETKFLSIAKDNVERLMRFIDELLDLATIESGRIAMRRMRFDISSKAKAVASSFKTAVDDKSLKFSISTPAGGMTVWGDVDRIQEVFDNLLSNAIKFAPDGGKVEFTLEDVGDRVRLTVSDNGPGIPKDYMPKVFEKFSSFALGRDKAAHGLGLGLSITKDIVEMHKGSIWVESEIGKGTKFFVDLPKDLRSK